MKRIIVGLIASIALMTVVSINAGQTNTSVILKGKVFLSDKKHPVANAAIQLLPDKKSDDRPGAETKTNENGDYQFNNLAAGKYSVYIKSFYKRHEDVPCQLLLGKTKDDNSTLVVLDQDGQIIQQVMIKSFSVKAGKDKEILKDFDITCSPVFGK